MEKLKNTSKLILLILFGISAFYTKSQTVVPANEAKNYLIDFYMPKLELSIELVLDRQEFIPSEFSADKTKKFLPVKQGKHHKTFYQIKDIVTTKNWIADKERHFAIIKSKHANFSFTPYGTLAGINCDNCNQTSIPEPQKRISLIKDQNLTYNKFFIKKNSKPYTDTTYKIIRRDSTVIKKPVIIRKTKLKKEKDKIYDLVHYLIKTRKRKFRLISGLDTINYYPEALKIKLKNLDSLENKLYNLLAGYEKHSELKLYFDIDLTKKSDTIAFINPYRGLTNINGLPVIVKLENDNPENKNKTSGKGIPYILPKMVKLSIWYGNSEIYNEIIPVPQLGEVKFINAGVKTLEYYPWGGIKSLHTND